MAKERAKSKEKSVDGKLTCGLVMPISPIDGCSADHWSDVRAILTEAAGTVVDHDLQVELVSDADDVGVIQKRIVQNLYRSHIVICDVSAKNPNVMFELGMRLAFDKPTVIVKDDKTDYTFDTGVIEHLVYPRDLRFGRIVGFKEKLAKKIAATLRKAKNDPDHSTFLKSFGTFKVATLDEHSVPADKVVLSMLEELQRDVAALRARPVARRTNRVPSITSTSPNLRSKREIRHDVRRLAREWSIDHGVEFDAMIGNEEFLSFLMDRTNPHLVFDDRHEFRRDVERTLYHLSTLPNGGD